MISDSHTDFLTELKTIEEREKYVANLKTQGVKSVSCAVFTTEQNLTFQEVKAFNEEILQLKTKYGVDLLFSVEDLGFLNQSEIEDFVALKPISVTLTWHNKNKFAGGDMSTLGLTKKGKELVKLLEKNNVLIDTAHLSRKSFWNFVNITTKPIYNSHSNIFSLHKHNRNLTNKQIKRIVETNGYLGLTIYDEFVAGKPITSLEIAKQFDYLIKKFGYTNFGFGTDFYGIDKRHLPKDVLSYFDLKKQVSKHLLFLGHTRDVVDCIMYKNFDNFLKRARKN